MTFTKRFILIFAISFLGIIANTSAQPRPDNNSDGSEVTGPPIGGGNGGSAPIGGGLFLLLAMGAGYAGRKIYIARKSETL